MNDIVERLRSWVKNQVQEPDPASVILAAADEIARLRLLALPIAGTVESKTGMDFIPWSVAASVGQAADISRRTAVPPPGFEMVRLSQWIPVSERLPEEDVDVLVMTHYGMHVADLDEDGMWNASHGDSWQFPLPTHWMPLPEPPQEAT
jgi:hypothetical protein